MQTGASAINAAHVDHCHVTNVVRGILCRGCNVGLGQFEDDSVRLRNAADYLDTSRLLKSTDQLLLKFTDPVEASSDGGDVEDFLLWHDPKSLLESPEIP